MKPDPESVEKIEPMTYQYGGSTNWPLRLTYWCCSYFIYTYNGKPGKKNYLIKEFELESNKIIVESKLCDLDYSAESLWNPNSNPNRVT